jgi:hypothetical protein
MAAKAFDWGKFAPKAGGRKKAAGTKKGSKKGGSGKSNAWAAYTGKKK